MTMYQQCVLDDDLSQNIALRSILMYLLGLKLGIHSSEHITNPGVKNTINLLIGCHKGVLEIVKERKVKLFGQTTRSTGLAKMILQGTVTDRRKKGRPKKKWTDNVI